MDKQMQVFENQEFGQIRIVMRENEPWFVAADVCKALDVDRTQTRRLDEDEKGMCSIHTPGGDQEVVIINEPGLYSLVLGSRKPQAKEFKRWVTHDILPTIRKTGAALEAIEFKGNIDGLVYSKDGIAMTDSLSIAKVFERNHRDILRAIDDKLSSKNTLCAQFCADHIHLVRYLDTQNKIHRRYELDEEGFSFVALSLTGEKADQFKIRYIESFAKMKLAMQNMFKARVVESVLPQDNRMRQYVYVLHNPLNDTVKIGVAHDVEKRLHQLQTGAGVELELVYQSLVCSNAFSIERDVHEKFADCRTFGEWFRVNPSDVINFLEQQTFVLRSEFVKYLSPITC